MLKTISRVIFAVVFVAAGINHFINQQFYVGIVPPYLPWPQALVIVSGAAEVVLGIGLLIPRIGRLAAWGLIALLIAVSPANIHMAIHPELYASISPVLLWLRLPIQGVLILWAFWYTRADKQVGLSR